jgi:hypothetical protein
MNRRKTVLLEGQWKPGFRATSGLRAMACRTHATGATERSFSAILSHVSRIESIMQ